MSSRSRGQAAARPLRPFHRRHAKAGVLVEPYAVHVLRPAQAVEVDVVKYVSLPVYWFTRAKDGLVMYSSSTPRPSAKPCTKVVLPAPRSPCRQR